MALVTKNTPDIKQSLDSLSFKDMTTRLRAIGPACGGTCEWFLRHPKYLEWKERGHGLLFVKGMLGSGKSTLMKYALAAEKRADPGTVASFFFSGSGAALQRSAVGLFRALLYQLLPQIPELFVEFRSLFQKLKTREDADGGLEWRKDELQQFFKSHIATKGHRIRLFIDALDECREEDAGPVLRFFHDVVETTGSALSICFSCRQFPVDSPADISLVMRLEEEEQHDHDISTFIRKFLESNFKSPNSKIVEDLEKEISAKASGIFRLAELTVGKALDWKNKGKPKAFMLDMLRRAPPALDDSYRETLEKIDKDDRPEALHLMQWICLAMRPLSLTELRFAMASDWPDPLRRHQQFHGDVEKSEEYEDHEQMQNLLRNFFPGLVEVALESDGHTVQLVHQSCHEFLKREGLQMLSGLQTLSEAQKNFVIAEGHHRLARTCINYTTLEDAPRLAQSDQIERLAFLNYAATSWVGHAQEAEKALPQDDLLGRFQWPSREIFQRWIDCYWAVDPASDERPNRKASLLHMAAEHGIQSIAAAILRGDHVKLDEGDDADRSPLFYAAQRGHKAIVEELLLKGAKTSCEDFHHRTALWYAISNGHGATVRLLLDKEGDDAGTRQSNIQSSLWLAARHGHKKVVELLLERKVDRNLSDEGRRTLLWHAAAKGRTDLVRLLLDRGADPNLDDANSQTPLSLAADNGHDSVIALLLGNADVDADRKDVEGRTALSLAADNGHLAVVRSLLMHGVEIDSLDEDDRTALWYGAMSGHDKVVKLLLEHGASVTAKDRIGWSPLFWAAGYGHTAVVHRLLAEKDLDPALKDSKGRTALSYAVENRHDAVVAVFTERGVSK